MHEILRAFCLSILAVIDARAAQEHVSHPPKKVVVYQDRDARRFPVRQQRQTFPSASPVSRPLPRKEADRQEVRRQKPQHSRDEERARARELNREKREVRQQNRYDVAPVEEEPVKKAESL